MMHCPMCGMNFDPEGRQACASCPLQSGCQLVCCPNCGFELIDVKQSWLAQTVSKLFFRHKEEDQA